MSELLTPSQTVGPYFTMQLPWPAGPFVVPEGTEGAVTIIGRLYDGADRHLPLFAGGAGAGKCDVHGIVGRGHAPRIVGCLGCVVAV